MQAGASPGLPARDRGSRRPRWPAHDVAAAGAVMGTMVALGYALAGVPNVEVVTLTAFIGGWWLGPVRGGLAASAGEFLFSTFNPMGPALPAVLVGQITGMALTAVTGGLLRAHRARLVGRRPVPAPPRRAARDAAFSVPLFAAVGVLVTLAYDVLTNAGSAIAMGMTRQMPHVIAAGVAFSILHVVSNAVVFGVLAPPALFMVEKRRGA